MTGLPTASVVVPTFDRLCDLQRVVAAIVAQMSKLREPCELVVVDDGSSDGTGEWLDERAAAGVLKVVHQTNAGPARARNRGVAAADGSIVLFLGDDTEPAPGWLREHLEAHRLWAGGTPTAVLGYTSFPTGSNSSFLRWINEHGAQFGYALIGEPNHVDFNFFYTSNVSLPKQFFLAMGGFREDFPAAAWEDIEFAYRAVAAGMRLRYVPRARTVHHHDIDLSSFCRRQQLSGRSAAIFASLHPELAAFLGVPCAGTGNVVRRLLRPLLHIAAAAGEHVDGLVSERLYRRLLDGYYLEGLEKGLQAAAETC